jgi:ribonuclease E
MTKLMLIDAANPEEVRVCVLHNGKVEDFDFESASRKPLRGNIYLARVTRVEPSLQAAFVEFGGNRHGFLAFNEIHPDYYQIPISDRRLIQAAEAEETALAAALSLTHQDEDDERALEELESEFAEDRGIREDSPSEAEGTNGAPLAAVESEGGAEPAAESEVAEAPPADFESDAADDEIQQGRVAELDAEPQPVAEFIETEAAALSDEETNAEPSEIIEEDEESQPARPLSPEEEALVRLPRPELIERYREARRKRIRLLRNYKIQEVVKRRQILLVQVVKEERGNKGAALTTYLSLAGRYCVLMPNTARGGGISRKIPIAADRKRLRRIVDGLDVPKGMGLIIRTAGAKRTKAEIKRDYDYLVRLWENIRTLTLKSIAPCLIYEEASLIKRAIRDLYDKDIGAVLVEGENGYREAKDFMKMLMPSHAKNVQPYKEKTPLFLQYNVESQLDAMYRPTVRLKSGGYIVINQTEALIAIDVNSGKSTRERNIEQTALRTNLEAAEEAARQCRLRDLAGLIVIDFIDMEEPRNNRAVEKRLKDALRHDRARIQLGRISGFGLLEMSRQRRRSGIVDGTTHTCPTCGGAGAVRSHEMAALRILRAAENDALASRAGNLQIKAALDVTLYILNQKREWLRRIETDYGVTIEVIADATKAGDNFEIEKTGARTETAERSTVVRADTTETIEPDVEAAAEAAEEPEAPDAEASDSFEEERGGRRRRRRRRRRREGPSAESPAPSELQALEMPEEAEATTEHAAQEDGDTDRPRKRRRRGRRGGRRGRRPEEAGARSEPLRDQGEGEEEAQPIAASDAFEEESELWPAAERTEPPPADQPLVPEPPASAAPARDAEARSHAADNGGQEGEITAETPSETARPARRGWWNRALGR